MGEGLVGRCRILATAAVGVAGVAPDLTGPRAAQRRPRGPAGVATARRRRRDRRPFYRAPGAGAPPGAVGRPPAPAPTGSPPGCTVPRRLHEGRTAQGRQDGAVAWSTSAEGRPVAQQGEGWWTLHGILFHFFIPVNEGLSRTAGDATGMLPYRTCITPCRPRVTTGLHWVSCLAGVAFRRTGRLPLPTRPACAQRSPNGPKQPPPCAPCPACGPAAFGEPRAPACTCISRLSPSEVLQIPLPAFRCLE